MIGRCMQDLRYKYKETRMQKRGLHQGFPNVEMDIITISQSESDGKARVYPDWLT